MPDPRLDKLSELSKSKKTTPTAIQFVDIAGLVKGASAGEGLGNQFLSHIREVDAIIQVVRCFIDPDVHHVSASIDPIRDIEVINTELVLSDLAAMQKRHDRLQKEVRAGEKSAKAETLVIEKLLPHLDSGKPAISAPLDPVFGKEKEYIEELKEHYRHGGLGDVKIKRYLIDVLEEELAPIRRRREELAKNPEAIMEMLHKGSLAAEKVAAQTLTEVKKAMGIQYF